MNKYISFLKQKNNINQHCYLYSIDHYKFVLYTSRDKYCHCRTLSWGMGTPIIRKMSQDSRSKIPFHVCLHPTLSFLNTGLVQFSHFKLHKTLIQFSKVISAFREKQ